jgi:parallel beta-helix repeat protein
MNTRLSLQQFKFLFFVQSLCTLLLAAPDVVSANGTDIKDTNYPIPNDAYFVSPNGTDSNSGKTPDSPWRVYKAITSAPPGATIVFRGGTYRLSKNHINKKLTLQPYPHEKVWLKGSIEVQGWTADGAIWRKDNWTYSFPPNMSSSYINPQYPMAGYRDMVYINGVSLRQVASKAEVVPGKFYVDSANKKLYIGENPVGKTVEATAQQEAFSIFHDSAYNSYPSDTVIRGLGFAHYAEQALIVGAPRIKLENNTFVWNGVKGLTFSGVSGGVYGISTDAKVQGNTFSYNGRKGLEGDRVHRLLLEGNTISYNNVENFSKTWDAAGAKLIRSDELILRNNLVNDNNATGMWIDISSTNARIVHNVVHNNKFTGIWFELSHKGIIAANVVYKNSTGIYILDSSDVSVYNNTLVNNLINLRVYDTNRKNTDAAQIADGITWSTRNNVFKNNILSNASGSMLFEASNYAIKEPSSLMVAYTDYNGYYRTLSSTPASVIKWSLGGNNYSVPYSSIAAFNSATGYEAHALAIDNVAVNPFFVDEANGDFHLKPGSAAIRHGDVLPPDVAAAIGLPSGVKVDLGALQTTVY